MNQAAIDRGIFRSTFYRTYVDQEHRGGPEARLKESFEHPDREVCKAMRYGDYGKVDADGLASPGTRVSGSDVIIGKTSPMITNQQERSRRYSRRDSSTMLRPNESGIVDQVSVMCLQ